MIIRYTPDSNGGFTPPKVTTPTHIKVELPSEPPPEVLKREFKMDDSLLDNNPSDGRVIIQDKIGLEKPAKMVEEPKTEESKTEDKPAVEEKVEKKVTAKEEKEPAGLKAPGTKKEEKTEAKTAPEVKVVTPKEKRERDLSSYSSEEQTVLRQMSNEAFEFTSKLLKDRKEFDKSKDNTFLQHPDAYVLSPQYKELVNKSSLAQREGDYWQACLEQMEAGKAFKELTGWDGNGNPQFGDEIQPTKRVEELVRLAMSKAYGIADTMRTELKTLPEKFKSTVNTDLKQFQDERAKRFSWVADPKYLDYTVSVPNVGEVPVKDVRQELINFFPPYLRQHPAVDIAADMFAAFYIQDAELREARNGKKMEVDTKKEDDATEPSSSSKPGKQPDAIGGVREFSLAGLPMN